MIDDSSYIPNSAVQEVILHDCYELFFNLYLLTINFQKQQLSEFRHRQYFQIQKIKSKSENFDMAKIVSLNLTYFVINFSHNFCKVFLLNKNEYKIFYPILVKQIESKIFSY